MRAFTEDQCRALTAPLTFRQKATFDVLYAALKKDRDVALLLAVLPPTGLFGAGRFYLGDRGRGFLHIGLTCAFVLPGVVYWMVDCCLIGRDCDVWNRNRASDLAAFINPPPP